MVHYLGDFIGFLEIPAVNSAIPQIVSEDLLMKANGINSTMQSVANFAAPAAAGVVMSIMALRTSMLIDVATAVVGIAVLIALSLPLLPQAESRRISK